MTSAASRPPVPDAAYLAHPWARRPPVPDAAYLGRQFPTRPTSPIPGLVAHPWARRPPVPDAAYLAHPWARSATAPPNAPCAYVALGRKNWLFAGSENGGEAAAIGYTLIESAKALKPQTAPLLRSAVILECGGLPPLCSRRRMHYPLRSAPRLRYCCATSSCFSLSLFRLPIRAFRLCFFLSSVLCPLSSVL